MVHCKNGCIVMFLFFTTIYAQVLQKLTAELSSSTTFRFRADYLYSSPQATFLTPGQSWESMSPPSLPSSHGDSLHCTALHAVSCTQVYLLVHPSIRGAQVDEVAASLHRDGVQGDGQGQTRRVRLSCRGEEAARGSSQFGYYLSFTFIFKMYLHF